MKNIKITIMVMAILLFGLSTSACGNKPVILPEGVNIFVSTKGNDANNGSFDSPFLTFERAKQEVRDLLVTTNKPITVNIREGDYYMNDSLHFTAEDSGTKMTPVTWQAYNGEEVRLIGAEKLSPKTFTKVLDPNILSKISNEEVKSNLYSIDLTAYIDEMTQPIVAETITEISDNNPQIYINGQPLTFSRWPNKSQNASYIYVDRVKQESISSYHSVKITSASLFERSINWSGETWNNLYFYSFLSVDWFDGFYDIESYDRNTQSVILKTSNWDIPSEMARFYVLNLLEEIDLPYESYIDYEKNIVYFYAPENFEDASIYFAYESFPIVMINDVQYLTLKGLTITYTRGKPIHADRVSNITIDGCTIAHSAQTAIFMDAATNSTIKNCHIYDIDGIGIYLWDGGLRETLTSSNNLIENNNIHHVSRGAQCYRPPIMVNSVGVVIKNNELHDIPHLAIDLSKSNDAIVEYNEIYNAGLDTSDMGAIYYGNDPFIMGLIIRYNYFHDIGNTYGGYGQQAIFSDDGASMPYIYGNIFFNASDKTPLTGSPIKANGSQFGIVKNNIFIDSPTGADFCFWTFGTMTPFKEDYWLLQMYGIDDNDEWDTWENSMGDKDPFNDTWKNHYKNSQWEKVWDYLSVEGYETVWSLFRQNENERLRNYAYENAPMLTNRFQNNICVNIEKVFSGNAIGEKTFIGNKDIFVNYDKHNFKLTPKALKEIRELISDFEEIPLDNIGISPYFAYDRQWLPSKIVVD